MTTAKKSAKKTAKKSAALKTAKKLLRAHNARVEKDNAAFAKMTPAQKRVAIARDVLAQLSSGRLQAKTGVWLVGDELENSDLNRELRDVLGEMKTCQGCLIGGVFMCAVEKADKLKVCDLTANSTGFCGQEGCASCGTGTLDVEGDEALNYLRKFFSPKQLEMMECAFERGMGAATSDDLGDDTYDMCVEFGSTIEEAKDRMRLVMENVILNKGTFRPNKKPVMTYVTPGFVG